jgi:hypothetical protein
MTASPDFSDPAAICSTACHRVYGAPGGKGPGAGLSRQIRLHSRLTDATRTNHEKLPIVARALAFVSLAALLAGCKTASQARRPQHSDDYRLRHPIAVREKASRR